MLLLLLLLHWDVAKFYNKTVIYFCHNIFKLGSCVRALSFCVWEDDEPWTCGWRGSGDEVHASMSSYSDVCDICNVWYVKYCYSFYC